MKNFLAGLSFAALWGSGSVSIKLGIQSAQPLVLINARFFIAAFLMLIWALLINKERMPNRQEWRPLILCGLLSMTIYASAFVFAMKEVTPGIGTLGAATCPLIISVLNAVWSRLKITWNIWFGLGLGILGVAIAIFPLLQNAYATTLGVALLAFSMVCYSVGSVYYQRIDWQLPRLSINAWQVLFGAIFQLPFTLYYFDSQLNTYNSAFWLSVFWLVVPISMIAVQLWLYLLKAEPTKAALWMFLCPIFGFFFAHFIMGEPITFYTYIGTFLVIMGLYLGKK